MMVRAIIRRDMGEHSWLLFPACLLSLVALVVSLGRNLGQPDAVLEVFADFVVLVMGPLTLLLARQLVVVEHARRGYDLLEALPARRWAVLPAKAVMAATLLAGVLVGGVALTAALLGVFGQVPADTSSDLARNAAGALTAALGVAFLVAAFGRHRHVAAVALVAGVLVWARAGHEVGMLPPVRLARERFTGPAEAVGPSVAIGLVALALAAVVVSWRRVTRFVGGPVGAGGVVRAIVCAAAVAAFAAGDGLTRRPALRAQGPLAGEGSVRVRIPDPSEAERAGEIADDAGAAVDALTAALGRAPRGPLLVEPAPGMVAWGTERLVVRGADGVILRTDYQAKGWDQDAFRARLLDAVLDALAPPPDAGWALVREGYPRWLALARAGEEARGRERRRVAAVLASSGGEALQPLDAGAWRDRLADDDLAALGAWMLGRVEAARGADAVHALGRRLVAARPGSLGAALDECGAPARELATALDAAGRELLAAERAWLEAGPAPTFEVAADGEAASGGLALRFSARTERPGPRLAALLHRRAGSSEPWRRDEVVVAPGPAVSARTRAGYPRGARVACAFVVEAERGERAAGWTTVEVE